MESSETIIRLQRSAYHLLYVSGPMTGYPAFNFPTFFAAADQLRAVGYGVVNPAELSRLDPFPSKAELLRKDLQGLLLCDGLALLPGWEESPGALLEWSIAQALAMPIKLIEEWIDDETK